MTRGADRYLGRYRLGEVIGVGSFATAYLATDDRLEADVVIKVLAENHSLNPEVRERFIAEGRSLRRVRSPNVVTVHDIGESDRQQPYLVLEHADRGTLAARVASLRGAGWQVTAADLLHLVRSLVDALDAVHAAQLVHRDLSPSNVLLTTDGHPAARSRADTTGRALVEDDERVLLADLGLCKDLALNSGLTVAGGTAGFRPPEMESGPAVIDTRADLWALSAVVRWLCTDSDVATLVAPVLERSLATNPADRHPDVRSWLAEIEDAVAPVGAPAAPERVAPVMSSSSAALDGEPVPVPAPSAGVGRRTLGLGAAGVALAGLAVGWALRGDGESPSSRDESFISIDGPTSTRPGESATFTLERTGVSAWVWVLPTGEFVANQQSVTLTPSGPGEALISVQATDDTGQALHVEHQLNVVES
ncbi:serine/threonine-protein kinase [Ornithinibacter aureus]|nr:serine/threonine-protein kinase [Ornithinibacter aureus]KAF0834554.1 protein kinase-like protein [Ornithinibacter aureus]